MECRTDTDEVIIILKLSETERQLFQKRLEEGYDLGDEKYLRWKEQVKVRKSNNNNNYK